MRKVKQKNAAAYENRFDAIRKLRDVIPHSKRHQYNLLQVHKDGFIRIDEKLYLVQDIYDYEERSKKGKVTWKWQELELFDIENGLIEYLEVEDDDGLDITLSNTEVKIRELDVNFKDILSIADREEGSFQYKQRTYYYEDDSKAFFIKAGKEQAVVLYEFESDDNQYITIEAWGEEADDYEIFHSLPMDEQKIEIVAVGS